MSKKPGISTPVQYNEQRAEQAFELSLLGATDAQMALVLGVDVNTIAYWKRTHEEFREAIERGKLPADARVAHAIYKRATGFTMRETSRRMYKGQMVEEVTEKYYPPDVEAAKHWLSLRQRQLWSNAQTLNINHNTNVTLNLEGMTTEELLMLERVAQKALTDKTGGTEDAEYEEMKNAG